MEFVESELVSPRQLAKQSGWPERRIRNLIAQNQIKHIKIGANIYLPHDAIQSFVRSNMINPQQEQMKANCND